MYLLLRQLIVKVRNSIKTKLAFKVLSGCKKSR